MDINETGKKKLFKKRGKPFPKGNKLGGRKPLPPDILAARALSNEEMIREVIEIRSMTWRESTTSSVEEMPLGRLAIMRAYQNLDWPGIKNYEDRVWGRAQENINLNGALGINTDFDLSKLTDTELRTWLKLSKKVTND